MVRPTVMLLVLSEPLGINDVGQPVEDSKLFSEPWTWAPDAAWLRRPEVPLSSLWRLEAASRSAKPLEHGLPWRFQARSGPCESK
jgi:hypothetical protein